MGPLKWANGTDFHNSQGSTYYIVPDQFLNDETIAYHYEYANKPPETGVRVMTGDFVTNSMTEISDADLKPYNSQYNSCNNFAFPLNSFGQIVWSGTTYYYAMQCWNYGVEATLRFCEGELAIAPTYSNISINSTIAGSTCLFSCLWADETGLSKGTFSTNNTGYWVNETWTTFSLNPEWLNVTKTLNSSSVTVSYCWYANDTSNNWVTTPIYSVSAIAIYLNLRTKDSSGNILTNATVHVNNGTDYSTTVNSGGWANFTGFVVIPISISVQYQGAWVNGTFSVTSNSTIDINCTVYSLTVWVTDINGKEKSGSTLTLRRADSGNLTDYGLTPQTAAYYDGSYALYIWNQLANETYFVQASYATFSSLNTTVSLLSENNEVTLTIPVSTSSGTGPRFPQPTPTPTPTPPNYGPTPSPSPTTPTYVPSLTADIGWIIIVFVCMVIVLGVAAKQADKKRKREYYKLTI